jgi:hypothetical protein
MARTAEELLAEALDLSEEAREELRAVRARRFSGA